ncbi:MAG: hypothetical protein GY772_01940 [bacterium]|nr:hypothetical protein [bacterium]
MTTQMLAAWFEKCKFSVRSETPTNYLLESVNAIWKKWKKDTVVQGIVAQGDALYGCDGPFSSICQISMMCTKGGRDPGCLRWIFASILDLFRVQELSRDDVGPHRLRQDAKRVNIIDVILFKKQLLDSLLGTELKILGLRHVADCNQLQRCLADHSALREHCGAPNSSSLADDEDWRRRRQALASLSKPAVLFFSVC